MSDIDILIDEGFPRKCPNCDGVLVPSVVEFSPELKMGWIHFKSHAGEEDCEGHQAFMEEREKGLQAR